MSFNTLGQRLGATMLGMNNVEFDFAKQATMVNDVEHPDPETREASTTFWRSFCNALSSFEKQANGETQDYFLLRQLADQPLWVAEFQKMAEVYADTLVEGHEAAVDDELTKQATALGALVPGVLSRGAATAPTAIKGLLAAGIGTGMAGGGLYWALQRAATEDSDKKLDLMQAKIDEYNKLKAMLAQDADGQNTEEETSMQKKIKTLS
jgi:hypothetical protein